MSEKSKYTPGDGIRSLKTTNLFRIANFELYAKPNIVIMGIGLTVFASCLGYMSYMRHKYESLGFYSAIKEDGSEQFLIKESKWD